MAPKIIDENAKAYLAQEKARTQEILDTFERFRLELLDTIAGEGTLTIPVAAVAGRKVQRKIEALKRELLSHLRSNLKRGARMGQDSMLSEIKEIERIVTKRHVKLNVKASRILGRVENLLVSQYESSVARYGEELRGRMARVLSDGALKKQSFDQVSKRLAGQRGLVKQEGYKIERIVRTEFNEAYNHARNQSLVESKKVLPDLKKRWDAHLDNRTSNICEDLNNTIIEVGKDFVWVSRKGVRYTFQKPPAHPNCRSVVTPWRDAWKHLFDEEVRIAA